MKPRIGVLLTSTCYSTCYFEKVDPKIVPDMFKSRVEELVQSIAKLSAYIHQPFELIIADNSPADCIPTEQIIRFQPRNTLFIRSTENPGKQIGEMELIRDGVHLSYARGHRWLLKLTGRYHISGNWSYDNTIKMLEEREKQLYACLYGAPMHDSYHTRLHPLYRGDPGDDRILAGVLLAMFLCNPEYLVANRVFQKEYLYKNYEWVSSEQLFWLAVKDLPGLLHWPRPPFDGWYKDKVTSIKIQEVMKPRYNPIFEVTENYNSLPFVDISSLLVDQDADPGSRHES